MSATLLILISGLPWDVKSRSATIRIITSTMYIWSKTFEYVITVAI